MLSTNLQLDIERARLITEEVGKESAQYKYTCCILLFLIVLFYILIPKKKITLQFAHGLPSLCCKILTV